jgi:hypothetical protein
MLSAIGWIVGLGLSFVVGAEAESWSWEGRIMLALVVVGVPSLIASVERDSRR